MANYVEITLLRVVCNEMESSSAEHDVFALTGAVVVDGTTHPFAHPAIPLKTGWTFSYHMPLFAGWVDQPTVGIGALGLDLDNSDWWVKNEEDIRKVTGAVARAASYLPVPYIDSVIDGIPEVVDFFTGLDEDDEVFRWAQDIPLEPLGPGQKRTKVLAPRASGKTSAIITISDWDYSVEFAITWQAPYPSFGPTTPVTWTTRPDSDTMPAAWLGGWKSQAAGIECWITRSEGSMWTLDIHTKERLPDGEVREFDTLGASIAGLNAQVMVASALTGEHLSLVSAAPAVLGLSTRTDAGLLVERLEPAVHALQPEEVVGDVWRAPISVLLPVAGDRVQLANGCVLEMRRTFADGVETGGRLVRYAGPAGVGDILHNPPIDVELERPTHIG